MLNKQSSQGIQQLLCEYVQSFSGLLEGQIVDAVNRIVHLLRAARDRGATVYVAGNGGSAATASHWVNDLGKAIKAGGNPPMKVMSLSDNISWLTALANDEGYERVFSGQLENFAQPGDILVVISASGNSRNLLEVVELARSRSVTTVALLGFDGGTLKDKVDEYLWFPTAKGAYGIVESGHALLCHILTDCLTRNLTDSVNNQEVACVKSLLSGGSPGADAID